MGSKVFKYQNYILPSKKIEAFDELTKDSYIYYPIIGDTFTVFESIDKILYLIYTNRNHSIISYNLINYEKINEIKRAHNKNISNFKYYLDNLNKRDLILSLSNEENNIKLWNIKNCDCLLKIENINIDKYAFSSSFIFNNDNQLYIAASTNCVYYSNLPSIINFFDINGEIIPEKSIECIDNIFSIDNYYHKKNLKNYFMICCKFMIKSYDYNKKRLYHEYHNMKYSNNKFIINDNNDIIKLIVPCRDNLIRIWNFDTGEEIKEIKIFSNNDNKLDVFCSLNDDYIFAGYNDNEKSIKLININDGYVSLALIGNINEITTLKIIKHPKYGECLISQGFEDDQIKLWKYKNI